MFRNFKLLPPEVLNEHERALVHHLCERKLQRRSDVNPDLVIGIVEEQDTLPPKKRAMPTTQVRQHTA
jgi:hypothetical protein